ncbi:site-specific integrase [Alicyclobacillus dauci]|uniref:Site-specific integrase n=1 Tax=Alicyclobacillus dauci TaxID=1475485 RepID=A0ABY6Z907_9BACL|nr:site-specific integrase [Alicyclobacillus dauci]WAH39360.1 site-specific integrase [Alicyclobacillus dauci]
MSQAGGTEEPRRKVRLSDSYFVQKGDQWVVQTVDKSLAGKVLAGATKVKSWGLREELVTRILLESGGRISEVCALTLGDWYAKGMMREATATSKGSNGKRVKFLRWTDDTAKLLRRYFDTDRRKFDSEGRALEAYLQLRKKGGIDLMKVPLFLSQRATALTPKKYRRYWNAACAAAGIEAVVHQARHWYVTEAIRNIYDHSRTEGEFQRKIRELIGYMSWKNGYDMIEIYEHYLESERHSEVQDEVHARLEELKQQAMNELERNVGPKANAAVLKAEKAPKRTEMDELYDFIVGGS